MGKVLEIGISSAKGARIQKISSVEASKGKGLLNDRKFRENNKSMKSVIKNFIFFLKSGIEFLS